MINLSHKGRQKAAYFEPLHYFSSINAFFDRRFLFNWSHAVIAVVLKILASKYCAFTNTHHSLFSFFFFWDSGRMSEQILARFSEQIVLNPNCSKLIQTEFGSWIG